MLVMTMRLPSNRPAPEKSAESRTPESDRKLVRRLLAADETAFDEFAARYLEALYRFALRRLDGDRELSREIVQRTLCKAFGKLSTYRGEGPFFGWLCACCRNEILMHFRSERSRPASVGLAEESLPEAALRAPGKRRPDRELLRSERGEHVHLALDLLPDHYARALEWKYLQGLSVQVIADRLERSAKAAESILTRARAAFRDRYEEVRRIGPGETRNG